MLSVSHKNVFYQVEKQFHTKKAQFLKACVRKGGVGYYLATHYYCHKKQMNWKVSVRLHHLSGKVTR